MSPRWEVSALQKRLEADRELPILWFEKVAGQAMPVVVKRKDCLPLTSS